jgi:hypothetical protein
MWNANFETGLNMKKVINVADQSVTFTFDGLAAITIAITAMSEENRVYAALHGMAARIGDNAAITKSVENNFTVTEAMRRAEVATMVEFYSNAGNHDWNVKVATGPRKPALNPTWVKMAELANVEYSVIAAKMAERDLAELLAMTNMPAPRG